jgi:hypothetical protein
MDPRTLQLIEECRGAVKRGRAEVAVTNVLLGNARRDAKVANESLHESLRRAEEALKQSLRVARLAS